MDKPPPPEHSLLVPIGISIFSIVGILIALAIVYLDKPDEPAPATPTSTPFRYIFLGTETSVPSPDLEIAPSEESFPEELEDPIFIEIDTPQAGLPTPILPGGASTQVSTLPGSNSQASPTVGTAELTVAERYDNTDPLLDFDGDWESQTNVADAYQGTLSVSNTIGSDLIFAFTGQQMIIGYLGDTGLGNLLISLDDQDFQVNQSTGREWVSPQLPNTEHFVIIIHDSGESINLDYINVVSSE